MWRDKIMMVGGIALLIGAATHITGWSLSVWLYTVGAVAFAAMQMADRYEGTDLVKRRLRRQQIIADVLLIVTAYLMIAHHHNEWVLTLTIAAFIEVYTLFRSN